ncbi:hypothetical protein SALBM311S_01592 [Streptomyces alboniger]
MTPVSHLWVRGRRGSGPPRPLRRQRRRTATERTGVPGTAWAAAGTPAAWTTAITG